MNPIVSVIMPNYNSQWFGQAINSVVRQTYEDWRLFVVDDASINCAQSVVDLWAREDLRIIPVHRDKNSGSPVVPRNEGMRKGLDGKYMAFLDSDDLWEPTKLEKQVKVMEHGEGDLGYHDMLLMGSTEQKMLLRRWVLRWSQLSRPYSGWCFKELLYKNFIPNSSVMIRTDFLKRRHEWLDPKYRISHDWDFWLKLSVLTPFEYVPEALGSLRLHDESMVSKRKQRRKESRQVVRQWKGQVPFFYYQKCLWRYYLAKIWDVMGSGC